MEVMWIPMYTLNCLLCNSNMLSRGHIPFLSNKNARNTYSASEQGAKELFQRPMYFTPLKEILEFYLYTSYYISMESKTD